MRIGYGIDFHQLVEGRDLMIGGVKIPHHKGALGAPALQKQQGPRQQQGPIAGAWAQTAAGQARAAAASTRMKRPDKGLGRTAGSLRAGLHPATRRPQGRCGRRQLQRVGAGPAVPSRTFWPAAFSRAA